MKRSVIAIFFLGIAFLSNGQTVDGPEEIVKEGKKLYHLGMASWFGSDLLLMKPSAVGDEIGYLSYEHGGKWTCFLFNGTSSGKVLASITVDSTFRIETARIDSKERAMRPEEQDLVTLRQVVLKAIEADTTFKRQADTTFDVVPLSDEQGKRVYVFSKPVRQGVVIFGNDYLLTFDDHYNIVVRKKLHQDFIPIKYQKDVDNIATSHRHLPEGSECITATDICTLMLYEKIAGWGTHTVVSWKYLSTWDCKTNTLTVIPQKELNKSVKERNDQN